MSVRIVIDSTADVAPEIAGRFAVVPLTVTFGTEEFVDGVTISHQEFYNRLIESDVMPTTSQATPAAFDAVLSEIAAAGDTAVIITLAHQLSGTCQSARLAAAEYREFYVVDSGSVTIGAGILAEYALNCADSGMSAREIAAALEEKKKDICLIAMLDTLEYLKRGGRISAAVAMARESLKLCSALASMARALVVASARFAIPYLEHVSRALARSCRSFRLSSAIAFLAAFSTSRVLMPSRLVPPKLLPTACLV